MVGNMITVYRSTLWRRTALHLGRQALGSLWLSLNLLMASSAWAASPSPAKPPKPTPVAAHRASAEVGVEATPLPEAVQRLLQQAQLPAEALGAWVQDVNGGPVWLAHQAQRPLNPASVAKLTTTYAALSTLGPAWSWTTRLRTDGTLGPDGTLSGSLYVQGSGDPKLVVERLWLGLRALRASGVLRIQGDLVLDRSAFAELPTAPGAFDGDPRRPYNVLPDAGLLNFHAHSLTLEPDGTSRRVQVSGEPFGRVDAVDVTVVDGPCKDWRSGLDLAWRNGSLSVRGRYPLACGRQVWSVADPEPGVYGPRLLAHLWRDVGGQLGGQARSGVTPVQSTDLSPWTSPPLAEVIRDINKFSNNVMAQQLFLSLPMANAENAASGPSTPNRARQWLQNWVQGQLGPDLSRGWIVDNGSGLSREGRMTARGLGTLLQQAWTSPVMPELLSSLPIQGQDGTLRRLAGSSGRAHLKTGSLRDVVALAGYVLADNGQRRVFVAIVNHEQASAARPALEALVHWAQQGQPGR
jgi:serine-type D-Ala-D-Ala carboxypeptidase/endopeptidase (penicillin-binding protein 4)